MTKPTALRKADVISKLEYAQHQMGLLMDELFAAKKADRDPKFLIHTAADIVGTARETFDYLGKDILEQYLLPTYPSLKNKKVYFPFHTTQVKPTDAPFYKLKTINHALYSELLDFVENIENKKNIPNTLFNYGNFISLKDMVNEKKHDRLLAYTSEDNQEILVEGNGLQMIIPKKKQQGWNVLHVEPGMLTKDVAVVITRSARRLVAS